jgi:carboxyl-terminal processing protease
VNKLTPLTWRVLRECAALAWALPVPMALLLAGSHLRASGAETNSSSGLASFDAAWTIIRDSYYDPSFHGLDWNRVRDELRPKAEAARTTAEARAVIEDMLKQLGGSHMALIPGEVAHSLEAPSSGRARGKHSDVDRLNSDPSSTGGPLTRPDHESSSRKDGDVGCEVRWVGGQVLVSRVASESPAAKAGVRPGWIVQAIGDEAVADILALLPSELTRRRKEFLAWQLVSGRLAGAPGTEESIRLLNGANQPVECSLMRRKKQGEPAKLGYLPTFYARLESQELKSGAGHRVGYIRFNLWMIPIVRALDEKVDRFRHDDGMILDLRGNLGGVGGMILGVSGHFLKDRVSLGTLKMRGNDLQFFANPRRVNPAGQPVEPYAGPLAILIDGLSLSAAEIFVGGMQALGRARVFGEPSGGQALPAIWDRLPNGDVLYHAFGDFINPKGVRLEGVGVVPDETVALRREDLLVGRDAPLEAALSWIDQQAQGRSGTRSTH